MPPPLPRRLRDAINRISAEHTAISECVLGIERALQAQPTSRWHHRLAGEVRALGRCLDEHRRSAEADAGVLPDVEVALGRNREVSTARRLHRSAELQVQQMLAALNGAPNVDEDQLRKRGRRLSSAIRRHHQLEADLILMTFNQDIGVGD